MIRGADLYRQSNVNLHFYTQTKLRCTEEVQVFFLNHFLVEY